MLMMMILNFDHMCRVGLACGLRTHMHGPGDFEACKHPCLVKMCGRQAVCYCRLKAPCMGGGHDNC